MSRVGADLIHQFRSARQLGGGEGCMRQQAEPAVVPPRHVRGDQLTLTGGQGAGPPHKDISQVGQGARGLRAVEKPSSSRTSPAIPCRSPRTSNSETTSTSTTRPARPLNSTGSPRQMPVRDADVRCCIKCNERRPDNAQEERSHLAVPLLSWEFFSFSDT